MTYQMMVKERQLENVIFDLNSKNLTVERSLRDINGDYFIYYSQRKALSLPLPIIDSPVIVTTKKSNSMRTRIFKMFGRL